LLGSCKRILPWAVSLGKAWDGFLREKASIGLKINFKICRSWLCPWGLFPAKELDRVEDGKDVCEEMGWG
jgi:hypothetical protein